MGFEIVTNPKKAEDVVLALHEVNASHFIGGWSQKEFNYHLETGTLRLFYEGEILAGISAWIPFGGGQWCELGPFFTMDAFRGRGLGKLLISTAITVNREAGRNLYGVTKNDIVKHIFSSQGLLETAFFSLPPTVLLYLARKVSPHRAYQNLRKLDRSETPSQFIEYINDGDKHERQ